MVRRNLLGVLVVLAGGGLLIWAFETSGEQASEDEELFDQAERFVEILRLVQKQYVRDVETKELFQDAIDGMLAGLDPFSNYIPEDELVEFHKGVRGKFGGIGIQIGMRRGLLTVISPLEDTPAYRAGVLAGDIIIEVEGKSTDGIRLDQAVKMLTGDPGTKVTMKVRHLTGEIEEITITRAIIEVHTIKGVRRGENSEWLYMLDEEKKIGYVRITSFVENSTPEVRKALETLQKDGMKSLILDLRFDPGGILKSAVEMSDLFIDDGVIVKTKGRTTPYWEATATREGTVPYFPMVVLVNRFSASASEIVSGALQDHHRAIIIGERTFGKGSVQNVILLGGEKSALKLTTSHYYLPSGRSIHREEDMTEDDEWGVVPDIIVPVTPEEYVAVIRARQDADVIRNDNDKPKTEPSETGEPEKDDPGAGNPNSGAPSPDADDKGGEPAPQDGPPGADAEMKEAEPVVDRQLQRALDVLRSMDVIQKYIKKAA